MGRRPGGENSGKQRKQQFDGVFIFFLYTTGGGGGAGLIRNTHNTRRR